MVQKRAFDDEEQYEISSKLPKQLKHADQPPLFSEIKSSEDGPRVVDTTGEGRLEDKDEVLEKYGSDKLLTSSEPCEEVYGCSEEDRRLDEPLHVPFNPEYFFPGHGFRHEDIHSLRLQLPPHKLVPIGPDFQADIPPCNPHGTNKKSSSDICSTSNVVPDLENEELAGRSVIPMPDSESLQDEVGAGRRECRCHDKGSSRCVRQHIVEAREKLRKNLGAEVFESLGFLDIGEQVAQKWTEEEEHLFHEIIFSNPPSMGRNFWHILSNTFPYRTKSEIVSYYFNVFMLRRRAEQNRFDPMNADSDNDEWRLSDDEEEDVDSVVESPGHHVGLELDTSSELDANEYDEGAGDETYAGANKNLAFEKTDKGYDDRREDHVTSSSKLEDKDGGERGDQVHQDAQDDSCTSFENGAAPASSGTDLKGENRGRWTSSYNGLSNISSSGSHDYGLEPCDAKLWDVGYVSRSKSDVDFLPTCSMIEEVFGDGSWNCKMDEKGTSS